MAGVGQCMVRRLQLDLIKCGDVVVNRNVEGVGVVFLVRDSGNHAVFFLVDPDKPAGQAFCRRGQQGVVQPRPLGFFIQPLSHIADDLQPQVLCFFRLAVVGADQRCQAFRQPDEAHGERPVLQDFADVVVDFQLVGVDPDPLAHQEGEVPHFLAALDRKPFVQLLDRQVDLPVQILEEQLDVLVSVQRDSGQVDGCEAQVASSGNDLPVGIVHVADNTGPAAHVSDFRFRMPLFIVLQVVRCIDEGIVREQSLGGNLQRQLEQVVVRLSFVVVDAFLHLVDLNREDRGFAVAQPAGRGQQQVLDYHAALRRGVQPVVHGTEGDLCPGSGMHGVQVVDKGFHGLVGLLIHFFFSGFTDERHGLVDQAFVQDIICKDFFLQFDLFFVIR